MGLALFEPELGDSGVVGTRGFVSGCDGRAVKVHLAVDQVVVRYDPWAASGSKHRLDNVIVGAVVPVYEGEIYE